MSSSSTKGRVAVVEASLEKPGRAFGAKGSRRLAMSLPLALPLAIVLPPLAPAHAAAPATETASDLDVSRFRGQILYVDFWASWCGPCQVSFPWMARMHERWAAKGLHIVAVNLDKSRAAADKFLAKVPAPFELMFSPDGRVAEQFEVAGMPHAFLYDRQGQLVRQHIGFLPEGRDDMQTRIEAMTKEVS